MQLDAQRKHVTAPVGPGMSHFYLLLGDDGTGLHHARLTPMSLAPHEHEAIQISIPIGRPAVSVRAHSSTGRDTERLLMPGQCYIVPPVQPHSFAQDRVGELINLYLAPAFFDAGLQDYYLNANRLVQDFTVSNDQVLSHHALFLRNRLNQTHALEKIELEAATIDITEHIAIRYLGLSGAIGNRSARRLPPSVLAMVLDRAQERCTQDLSIAELAAVARLSTVHFRRLFQNSTGDSPLEYIYRLRIHRAQAFLRRTNQSVQSIAEQVGFTTPSHFVAQFRRKVGVTPLQYRKEFRLRKEHYEMERGYS